MLAVAALFVFGAFFVSTETDADSPGEKVLFDMGNGETIWSDASGMGSIDDILRRSAADSGLDYISSAGKITINGITETTIGASSTGGSLSKSGTTGVKAVSHWVPFKWDTGSGEWVKITDISAPYAGESLAVGFYPDGIAPVETPEHQSSWTMIRGDSHQTGAQDAALSDEPAQAMWTAEIEGKGAYAAVLSAQGHVFVKYGASSAPAQSTVVCYTMEGEKVWEFTYPSVMYYELASPAIVGGYIYIPTSHGYIFKIPLVAGPGDNKENVTTLGNKPYSSLNIEERQGAMPNVAGTLTGTNFNNGPGSLVYDSGVIYVGACNGMMYCFDLDLNLIWSSQMGGAAYFFSHTVYDDYIFAGVLNGTLYIFNKVTGSIIDQELIYTRTVSGREFGSVQQISVFEEDGKYVLMFGVSDGRGMSSMIGGLGIYEFDGSSLSKRALIMEEFGLLPNYVLPVENEEFKGIYFTSSKGLFRMDTKGNYELLNDLFIAERAPMVLVNGDTIFLQSYTRGEPLYSLSLDGSIIGEYTPDSEVMDFAMTPPLIIDGWVFSGNDSGINVMYGQLDPYGGIADADTPLAYT